MLINKGNETVLKTACESGDYFGQLKKDGYFLSIWKETRKFFIFIFKCKHGNKAYLLRR